jgi:hypothetical protein
MQYDAGSPQPQVATALAMLLCVGHFLAAHPMPRSKTRKVKSEPFCLPTAVPMRAEKAPALQLPLLRTCALTFSLVGITVMPVAAHVGTCTAQTQQKSNNTQHN